MDIDDLIHSERFRNSLMDIIKCANDEYQSLIRQTSEHGSIAKNAREGYEYSIRRRLYSVLLNAFGVENDSEIEDSFVDRIRSFIHPLGGIVKRCGLSPEAKKVVAASLATSIAAAAEDARDWRLR